MNTYELNAWIAEHVMGWEYKKNPHGWRLWFPLGLSVTVQETVEDDFLPSFSTDRNFCAQAEVEIAGKVDVGEYVQALREVVAGILPEDEMVPDSTFTYHLLTATAHQRCEAMYAIFAHRVSQQRT